MNKHAISTDDRLNEELKNEVQTLRGGMMKVSEKQPIPERFLTESCIDTPSVKITDAETGRSTVVPLFAYREVREALNNLFGELTL